jgi:hypothetical protein
MAGNRLQGSLGTMKKPRTQRSKQSDANCAWIAFRLNEAPVRTRLDGDFNCLALMDAASGVILGMEMIPASDPVESQLLFQELLRSAESAVHCLPRKLYLMNSDDIRPLAEAVVGTQMEVFIVPVDALESFIGDARRGFAERFEEPLQ